MITIFQKFFTTKEPKHIELSVALKSIRLMKDETRAIIEELRVTTDKEKKAQLKKELPCIIFSGKFSKRADSAMISHSGYAVIDLDHVPDVFAIKQQVKLLEYVKSAFVSPSGDGLKIVVRIPSSVKNHRKNYAAVFDDLKNNLSLDDSHFDSSNLNESRICYASYDPDIYIASAVKIFAPPEEKKKVLQNDYNKINIAVNMIRLSTDGEKHMELLKASHLMGGYIASGIVEESLATQVLESEIQNKNISNFKDAQTTIQKGIQEGKTKPLYETEQIESQARVQMVKVQMFDKDRGYEFLTDRHKDREDVKKYIDSDFSLGKETGHAEFDKYFRFKEGVTNVVLGHANTGKSMFMWWLAVISAVLLKWKWIMFSAENKTAQIKKKLIEFKSGKSIEDMNIAEVDGHMDWIDEMFIFIRIDRFYSATEILEYAETLCSENKFNAMMVDPYNGMAIDRTLWKETGSNRHEYDYTVASRMNNFAEKYNISLYINAHAISEALRRKHRDGQYASHVDKRFAGQPMPPESADIEGGGKFVNRVTGFFMVVHRYIYDNEDMNITKIEIKKVKDTETGGKQTAYQEPVEFKMLSGMNGFYEMKKRDNPMQDYRDSQKEKQSTMELLPTYSLPVSKENVDLPFGAEEEEFNPFD